MLYLGVVNVRLRSCVNPFVFLSSRLSSCLCDNVRYDFFPSSLVALLHINDSCLLCHCTYPHHKILCFMYSHSPPLRTTGPRARRTNPQTTDHCEGFPWTEQSFHASRNTQPCSCCFPETHPKQPADCLS